MVISLKNEEPRVLGFLNRFTTNRAHELAHLYHGDMLMDVCRRIETRPFTEITDILSMFESMGYSGDFATMLAEEMVEFAYDELCARQEVKLQDKLARFRNRAANRATYTPESVYEYYQVAPGNWRWKFKSDLRSTGLLTQVVTDLYGNQEEPVALGILLDMPEVPDEARNIEEAMSKMVEAGIAISGERLGWNRNSPGWNILVKTFPDPVDMSAYCHGLNAPVLPEGFLRNVPVTFRKLTDEKGTDLRTDGSGIYHPNTPEMQVFIRKYGLVPCQLRVLHPQSGLFAKGIMFPSELALDENGNPGINLDWVQIKAGWKPKAKQNRIENKIKTVPNCYVGILQCWSRPTKLSGCFEVLENIKTNKRTIEITQLLVEHAINALKLKGIDGLAAEVGRKDPIIKLMLQLIAVARMEGMNIHAAQIPRIRDAIKDRLARKLYTVEQGAGLRLPAFVVRMDATVPPGKCVVSGMHAGCQVAAFRLPLILAQGLLKMETIRPKKHHLVNGEMAPNTLIINPQQALQVQGDDDGDLVGLTNDPLVIELFSHRLDEKMFHIEPQGVKKLGADGKPLSIQTSEGLDYLKRDHRGPVGRCTVWRARMLAISDYGAAIALSIAIQECIDQGKRIPEWSDIRLAADLSNWEIDSHGEYHFTKRFKPEELENGTFPMALVKDWVDQRLIAAGCIRKVFTEDDTEEIRARDPLWWRMRGKRVDVDNWSVPPETPEFTQFENLVHIAARHAHSCWQKVADELDTAANQEVPMSALLPMLFLKKGITEMPLPVTTFDYNRIKQKLGLSKYNQTLAKLMSSRGEDNDSAGAIHADTDNQDEYEIYTHSIAQAQRQLESTLRQLFARDEVTLREVLTVWAQECGPGGNPNNALRVVCWEGSPVLSMLGIVQPMKCTFLHKGQKDRLQWIIDEALKNEDPFEGLQKIIMNSRRHGEGFTALNGEVIEAPIKNDNGEPVHFWECPDCMAATQDALVRTMRSRKAGRERAWLVNLHSKLK